MENKPSQIYMDKHEICLAKNDDDQYFPFTYKNNKGDWVVPLKGDIIFDWITYVKRTVGSEINPITRKKVAGNLNPMQWGISINIINSLIEYKTDIYSLMASRQTGRHTCPLKPNMGIGVKRNEVLSEEAIIANSRLKGLKVGGNSNEYQTQSVGDEITFPRDLMFDS